MSAKGGPKVNVGKGVEVGQDIEKKAALGDIDTTEHKLAFANGPHRPRIVEIHPVAIHD